MPPDSKTGRRPGLDWHRGLIRVRYGVCGMNAAKMSAEQKTPAKIARGLRADPPHRVVTRQPRAAIIASARPRQSAQPIRATSLRVNPCSSHVAPSARAKPHSAGPTVRSIRACCSRPANTKRGRASADIEDRHLSRRAQRTPDAYHVARDVADERPGKRRLLRHKPPHRVGITGRNDPPRLTKLACRGSRPTSRRGSPDPPSCDPATCRRTEIRLGVCAQAAIRSHLVDAGRDPPLAFALDRAVPLQIRLLLPPPLPWHRPPMPRLSQRTSDPGH